MLLHFQTAPNVRSYHPYRTIAYFVDPELENKNICSGIFFNLVSIISLTVILHYKTMFFSFLISRRFSLVIKLIYSVYDLGRVHERGNHFFLDLKEDICLNV